MKKTILNFFLFTLSLQALGYELINLANTVVRTPTEILAEVGKTTSELAAFSCENAERFDLFGQTPLQNMAQDSLKILGDNKEIYTFINGEILDESGNIISKPQDVFVNSVLKALTRVSKFPTLKRLIQELQYSPYPFTIRFGGNRYLPNLEGQRPGWHINDASFIYLMDELKPTVEKLPFSQIGFGGYIYWNPKTKAKFIEADYIKRAVDTDIILMHEMYHAYDGMRGLLDRRFVKSEVTETFEFQPLSEYRAVRMENITRKLLGYKYRRYYGQDNDNDDTSDMLDETNEPEVFPTPCIEWL